MIVGNKWFYAILGTLFTILIVINLALWTTEPGFGSDMTSGAIGNISGSSPTKYIGFKSLFEIFGTFPGPSMSIETLNQYCNVFTNFEVTGIAVLDWFIALFRLITGPIASGIAIIGDIVVNLVWLFKIIFIDSWWNIYETHQSMYQMPLN